MLFGCNMNLIHVPSRPPLPARASTVTWSDSRYRECLADYDPRNTNLSPTEYCDLYRWINERPPQRTSVSLGERRFPIFEPWMGVPQVVSEPEPTKEELLHEPPIGTVSPSTKKELRMPQIVPDGDRWAIIGHDKEASTRGMTKDFAIKVFKSMFPSVVATPPTQSGGSMDLGNLGGQLVDIGLEALRSRVVQQNTPQPVGFFPGIAGPAVVGGATGLAADALDLFSSTKKKRRRRKRLATVSDIRDLAALKSILGNGDAFKTWIATHSR